MINCVSTRSSANIALVKYWGKLAGKDNRPATPSISLALEALKTETEIERNKSSEDKFFLNGSVADKNSYNRLVRFLNFWRRQKLIEGNFIISSHNRFPTGAGLASSSSGYAALSVGLSAFCRQEISSSKLSRLARRGSGSAARSIIGGLAALPIGPDPSARPILKADEVPWGMVVVEIEAAEKEIGSRRGMELCRRYSPYYEKWLAQARADYKKMLASIREMNFPRVGEITEANALAMHACMMANRPSLIYWSPATLEVIKAVRRWRIAGLESYFTIDAGPHVILLGRLGDLSEIARRARRLDGVRSAIRSKPAGPAEIVRWS